MGRALPSSPCEPPSAGRHNTRRHRSHLALRTHVVAHRRALQPLVSEWHPIEARLPQPNQCRHRRLRRLLRHCTLAVHRPQLSQPPQLPHLLSSLLLHLPRHLIQVPVAAAIAAAAAAIAAALTEGHSSVRPEAARRQVATKGRAATTAAEAATAAKAAATA
eukprot:scaffold27456_cov45-Phaeocystis_antarctica.AAC.3